MARKTIQVSSVFENLVSLISRRLQAHGLKFVAIKQQNSSTSERMDTEVTSNLSGPSVAADGQPQLSVDSLLQGVDGQMANITGTGELAEDLQDQLVKYGDTGGGIKALELQAVALQGQVLQGIRRRGSRRQLSRMDRLARAAQRRYLLADTNGPLQSLLSKQVEDALSSVQND